MINNLDARFDQGLGQGTGDVVICGINDLPVLADHSDIASDGRVIMGGFKAHRAVAQHN